MDGTDETRQDGRAGAATPATQVAARLGELVDVVAELLEVDGAALRLRDSHLRLRTVTRRGAPAGDDRAAAVRSAPVLVRDAVVGDLDAVDPQGWSETRQAALQSFAALVSDVLVLSAGGWHEDVAHLADRLPDLDGVAA
jgi:hypothetical protein